MLDPRLVLTVLCLYMGFLVLIARWAELKSIRGVSPASNPVVYSLSLAVYCTAWTYYGSVGKAATSGMLFLPIYLGPTVCIFLWWTILRKLVRLKTTHRITSIADFIAARYNRSQVIAAIATIIALVGTLPYIALQLKAVIFTFSIVVAPAAGSLSPDSVQDSLIVNHIGLIVVVLMIVFTIALGVRRLDPTERHQGMVMALAVECLLKLVAFLVAGFFVTYVLYDGFGDIFSRVSQGPVRAVIDSWGEKSFSYFTWTSYFILSMSAILFLPRQFHVAVVENSNERHILTAMWLFPLYMLLINVFVLPIALGGLLKGYPISEADTFVLRLPLHYGKPWLSLLVFLGGLSAAAGMIMISSVTMATMLINHLVLPLLEWVPRLGLLKRHLLRCRWAAVASFILIGYWFEERLFQPYMLVNIGLISFAAVLQFAPAILGGIFWRRGNKAGAILGLSAGFAVWCYTQLLPSFVRNGWISSALIERGPWNIGLLKPEALLGLTGLDPLSHTVLWSMIFNIGLYVLGSLSFAESREEQSLAEQFVGVPGAAPPLRYARSREAYIDLAPKIREIAELFGHYFPPAEVSGMLDKCLREAGVTGESQISIVQLVELHSVVEKSLAGSIGSAAAHKALQQETILTPRESRELSEVYGEILANLKLTPSELKTKIDYYQEREMLLLGQARELEEKVQELEREMRERKRVQLALQESEERYRGLVETMNEGLQIEDENGLITYVNDKLCQMWGCSRSEIIGHRAVEFVDEAQRNALQEEMERIPGREVGTYETTWVGKDGRKVPTIVSVVPIRSTNGQYKGSFAVITDISEIKTLEREKANIISMLAHDMRSSLTGIHGLGLRLLSKSAKLEEEKKLEYLEIINREASKLEALVDDFLEFSRLETGRMRLNFKTISLDTELVELCQAYEVKALQKNLKLVLKIDEPLPVIEADANRLRRVFTNLLDNALKFSRESGTITVVAQDGEHEILVQIVDEGIGIDPRELPYIFDLFHRSPDAGKREGYGIGLATVKAIVEGHGGRVHVDSKLGQGSVFSVFLPKERKTAT